MQYYIARLTLTGAVGDKEQTLLKSLQSGAVIERYGSRWVVANAKAHQIILDDARNSFISGRLVRYRDAPEDVYREARQQVETIVVERKVFGDGEFIIHPSSSLMAFVPSKGIVEGSFRANLALLIKEGLQGFFFPCRNPSIN